MEKDNIFDNVADPDKWWFWVFFFVTIPLWLIGEGLDLIGLT